jgi:hypothetical protein
LGTFRIIAGTILFAIILLGTNASAVELIEASNGNWGTIEVFEGNWQMVCEEEFPGQYYPDYRYTTKTILLPPCTTKIRLTQSGTDTAHLDEVILDGNIPVSIIDRSTDTELDPAKLSQSDYDVIDAAARTIEITWSKPGRFLVVTAVEENLIGGPIMWPRSGCLTYTLGGMQTFSQYIIPTSSHPASTYNAKFTTTTDDLVVYLDATGDNTLDPDGDWAELRVITPDETKKFRISDSETNWGTSTFEYTNEVLWQHKTYRFNIPLEEIGLSQGEDMQFQIAYYGTAAVGICGSVIDSCTNEVMSGATVTLFNETGITLIDIDENWGDDNPHITASDGLFDFYPEDGIFEDDRYTIKVEKTGYTTRIESYDYPLSERIKIYMVPEGGCSGIPEFPTIALPIVALIGLAFIFQRKKK